MFIKAFIPYFCIAVKTFIDKTDFVKRFRLAFLQYLRVRAVHKLQMVGNKKPLKIRG